MSGGLNRFFYHLLHCLIKVINGIIKRRKNDLMPWKGIMKCGTMALNDEIIKQ